MSAQSLSRSRLGAGVSVQGLLIPFLLVLNVNIDDSLHLHDDIGALESTVTFSPTWFFGFIFFFTLVKFKLTVWIYISWLGLAILFIDPQF